MCLQPSFPKTRLGTSAQASFPSPPASGRSVSFLALRRAMTAGFSDLRFCTTSFRSRWLVANTLA